MDIRYLKDTLKIVSYETYIEDRKMDLDLGKPTSSIRRIWAKDDVEAKKFSLPSQLAQSQDLALRQVPDGDLSVERHQVVLAHREHFNVLDDDHLIRVFIEYGVV